MILSLTNINFRFETSRLFQEIQYNKNILSLLVFIIKELKNSNKKYEAFINFNKNYDLVRFI